MTAQVESWSRMIVGITGGIGCGKSRAAAEFALHGFRCIDSDAIVRERILNSPDVVAVLRERYGDSVIRPDGTVERSVLAGRVFADDAELAWLEGLVHPSLFAIWRATFAQSSEGPWAVEVPLLFEKRLENWFDFTVCVACAPARQLARLEQRGLTRALAEQRISKQLPLAQKIERADFVLWNDGSPEFLSEQISRLVHSLQVSR